LGVAQLSEADEVGTKALFVWLAPAWGDLWVLSPNDKRLREAKVSSVDGFCCRSKADNILIYIGELIVSFVIIRMGVFVEGG
jgi:hypothetical protein